MSEDEVILLWKDDCALSHSRHAYTAFNWPPANGRWKRGKPRTIWHNTFNNDLKTDDCLIYHFLIHCFFFLFFWIAALLLSFFIGYNLQYVCFGVVFLHRRETECLLTVLSGGEIPRSWQQYGSFSNSPLPLKKKIVPAPLMQIEILTNTNKIDKRLHQK